MKEASTDLLPAEVVEAMRLKVPFVLVGEYLNELNSFPAQVWEMSPVKVDEIGELRQRDNTAGHASIQKWAFFTLRSAQASQTHKYCNEPQ